MAAIVHRGDEALRIDLHVLLNSDQTPESVFKYILTHELLHTACPGREVDGKWHSHPPEFFKREDAIVPSSEKADSWLWLWVNFHSHLRIDMGREGTFVKPGWRSLLRRDRVSMHQCRAIVGSIEPLPGGALIG